MAALGPRNDRGKVEVPNARLASGTHEQRVSKALGQLRDLVPQSGTAVLSFGAGAGTTHAQVVIADQVGIVEDSIVHAEIRAIATADHTVDDHILTAIRVVAANIVPGTGFTVHAVSAVNLTGQWTVAWSWS